MTTVVSSAQTLMFDAYDAALQLTIDAMPAGVVVFDGPQAAYPDSTSYVVFGTEDPTVDGLHTSTDQGVQDWESLGASARMETFVIWLTFVVWSGDDDFAALRSTTNSLIRAFGSALRPPPRGTGDAMLNNTLNLNGAGTGWCGIAVQRLRQTNTPNGIAVHAPVGIFCTARI